MELNVHTEHCCATHGCKYGDDDCPVANGLQKQSYECETCVWVREEHESLDLVYLVRMLTEEQKAQLRTLLG